VVWLSTRIQCIHARNGRRALDSRENGRNGADTVLPRGVKNRDLNTTGTRSRKWLYSGTITASFSARHDSRSRGIFQSPSNAPIAALLKWEGPKGMTSMMLPPNQSYRAHHPMNRLSIQGKGLYIPPFTGSGNRQERLKSSTQSSHTHTRATCIDCSPYVWFKHSTCVRGNGCRLQVRRTTVTRPTPKVKNILNK